MSPSARLRPAGRPPLAAHPRAPAPDPACTRRRADPGWLFEQRKYEDYDLLGSWSGISNKPSGDFTGDTRFSKPVNGALCPWAGTGSAEGCEEGFAIDDPDPTRNGGRAASCTGTGLNVKCACLAFGATRSALCSHPTGAQCTAKETVSQNITIPWNAKELKFRHRRDNLGGIQSLGSWARLVINRPERLAATKPACDYGICTTYPCNCVVGSPSCPGGNCPDWTYTPAACQSGQVCPPAQPDSAVLWETRCDVNGHGANACAMPCANVAACTDAELRDYLEATVDITPYVVDVDANTRVNNQTDYSLRRDFLRDHGDTVWKLSFQAHTIDLWSVFIDELSFTYFRPGCMNALACNYDPQAEVDDGTCVMKRRGCTDQLSANYDAGANTDPRDMCITFRRGEAPTLSSIRLGSIEDWPTITIDAAAAAALGPLGEGSYPYWSHQVTASSEAWGQQSTLADGSLDWNTPVGFKIDSVFDDATLREDSTQRNDLTLIVYKTFGPATPHLGLLHTARASHPEQTWRVRCKNLVTEVEAEQAVCSSNGLVRTTLAAGENYTVVVVPNVPGDYQTRSQTANRQLAPVGRAQGDFDLEIFATRGAVKQIEPVCGNRIVEGDKEQCDPANGAEAEWCSKPVDGNGGCQGIVGSFSFEGSVGPDGELIPLAEGAISIPEGEKTQVRIRRRMPPAWLPYTEGQVKVRVSTSDGTGPNQAKAVEDDYKDIDSRELIFETTEETTDLYYDLEIKTMSDDEFEYPTEHFFVTLDIDTVGMGALCAGGVSCFQPSKLEFPFTIRVDIVDDAWQAGEMSIVGVYGMCAFLLALTVWINGWTKGAHSKRRDKLDKDLAGPLEPMSGSNSPSYRGSPAGSPSFGGRSPSIAPANRSPSFARSSSIAPGAGSPSFSRRTSVLGGPSEVSPSLQSASMGNLGARRSSVALGAGRMRSGSIAGGAGDRRGMDPGALAALERMGSMPAMGARRKASIATGRSSPNLGLAGRMQGGPSSSGRRRRGSVKEVALLPGATEPEPEPAPAPRSSGRRRRGSVKEVLDPAVKHASAAKASEGPSKKSSSGRRRRGSVKEIDAAPAPMKKASSSGRRRRGSVKEVSVEPARKEITLGRDSAPSTSGRRRRGSVREISGDDAPKSGSSRKRQTSKESQPSKSDRKSGRRASVKPSPSFDEQPDYPPGKVVSELEGLGKSRRQRAGAKSAVSPVAAALPIANGGQPSGKSGKGRSNPSSDGGGSPAARDNSSVKQPPVKPTRGGGGGGGGGGYTNAAMFTAMQAALAHSEQVLDENKGLVGKCKLVGAALVGGAGACLATLVFLSLTAHELDQCVASTDGECLAHQVGDGQCDWQCKTPDCDDDGGDCSHYTDECRFAWYAHIHTQTVALDDGRDSCYWPASGPAYVDRLPPENPFLEIDNNWVMGCFSLDQQADPIGEDNAPTTFPLKNGKCDERCNFTACGWDNGDCTAATLAASPQCAPGCFSHMLGDRECHPECNTAECFFDMRDCEEDYSQWEGDTAPQAQNPADSGLPETLICDRETHDPAEMQCGLTSDVDKLQEVYEWKGFTDYSDIWEPIDEQQSYECQDELYSEFCDPDVCPDQACESCVPDYLVSGCEDAAQTAFADKRRASGIKWGDAVGECPQTAQKIRDLHWKAQLNELVSSLTHDGHECRDRCNTTACGNDGGVCYATSWCAPGCSPTKRINLVCDQECFTAACGWDAPACNSCDAFVDAESGLYADVIASLAMPDEEQSSVGVSILLLCAAIFCLTILVLRIRASIIVALDGFFDPLGKSLGRMWNKEDVTAFDGATADKSTFDFYTAPLWPFAFAGPLLTEIKSDWEEDPDDFNEDTGRYGLKYHSSSVEYSSQDGEPLRLELHQSQTAALATGLTLIFLFVCPAVSLVTKAQPRLAGATFLTELSIGNLFDPESACTYPVYMHELLSNNLVGIDDFVGSDEETGDDVYGFEADCGSISSAAHAVLVADLVAVLCFLIFVHSCHRDLHSLRATQPRLSDYCIHVSGLGRGTKMASDIDRMVKQLQWLNEEERADDVTVLPVWQDDLHWAWATLQRAELDARGEGETARGDTLANLVQNLEASRKNVGFPRPFSGHCICIFNKQHMARAMLHAYKKNIFQMVMKMLLPGEDLGGDEEEEEEEEKPKKKESTKVKVSVKRGGDPTDIDWLSMRTGGSVSFADTWRGRAVNVGAVFSLASVLMISLAMIFTIKNPNSDALEAAALTADPTAKAKEMLSALVVSPIGGSFVIVMYTDVGAAIVEFTVARAASYRAYSFSAQRQMVLIVSTFAQVCMLVIFPYMLLGDPLSWHSAGAASVTSVFGKCKKVIETHVNQELPGAEFMPRGFAEMTLWLQIFNAVLPHVTGLLNISRWPQMAREKLRGAGHDGKARGWQFEFSLVTSESYVVRTCALALCYSVVQPVGYAVGALGLLIGFSADRFRAGRCTSAAQGFMRRGGGVGDIYDHQAVLTLLQGVAALHALMLCAWIESVRLDENFAVTFSMPKRAYLYPLAELVLVAISLRGRMQGLVIWLGLWFVLAQMSYAYFPLDGGGPLAELPGGLGKQKGGPNIAVLLTVILSGVVLTPFYKPLSWFMGPMDPIELLNKGSRESDEEAYYTQSEMPFRPKSILERQVESDTNAILGL